MASPSTEAASSDAQALLTADEVLEALAVEVYDREGKAAALGDLVKGKRTILIFIRHFCKSSTLVQAGGEADALRVPQLSSIPQVHQQGHTAVQCAL